jgi:hypothetical protein
MNKLVTQTDLSELNARPVEAVISEYKRPLVLAGARIFLCCEIRLGFGSAGSFYILKKLN